MKRILCLYTNVEELYVHCTSINGASRRVGGSANTIPKSRFKRCHNKTVNQFSPAYGHLHDKLMSIVSYKQLNNLWPQCVFLTLTSFKWLRKILFSKWFPRSILNIIRDAKTVSMKLLAKYHFLNVDSAQLNRNYYNREQNYAQDKFLRHSWTFYDI